MKKLINLLIASVFLAAQVFTIDIKIMQLSIFRVTLFFITVCFFLVNLKDENKIKLSLRNDSSLFIYFYFFWFIYSVFTIVWVHDYYSWVRAVFFIGSGFLCIIILSYYVKSEKDISDIFNTMVIMIAFHNLIGWYELFTGNYKYVDMSRFDPYNRMSWNIAARTPVSMLGNPNDFATLMVFGVFIAYICLVNTKSIIWKLFNISVIASSAILCIRTNSRANTLGLLVGMTVLVYFCFLRKKYIKKILLLLTLPIVIYLFPDYFESFFSLISGKLYFNFNNMYSSDSLRLNLIRNGLVFLRDTFGFGTGAGNIEYWMMNKRLYYVGDILNMHNWWMEVLVGYGVTIFLTYIWIYVKMAKKLYSALLNTSDRFIKSGSLGLLCCMASFVIGSISSSSNISKEWLWLFWSVVIAFIRYIERHMQEVSLK